MAISCGHCYAEGTSSQAEHHEILRCKFATEFCLSRTCGSDGDAVWPLKLAAGADWRPTVALNPGAAAICACCAKFQARAALPPACAPAPKDEGTQHSAIVKSDSLLNMRMFVSAGRRGGMGVPKGFMPHAPPGLGEGLYDATSHLLAAGRRGQRGGTCAAVGDSWKPCCAASCCAASCAVRCCARRACSCRSRSLCRSHSRQLQVKNCTVAPLHGMGTTDTERVNGADRFGGWASAVIVPGGQLQ